MGVFNLLYIFWITTAIVSQCNSLCIYRKIPSYDDSFFYSRNILKYITLVKISRNIIHFIKNVYCCIFLLTISFNVLIFSFREIVTDRGAIHGFFTERRLTIDKLFIKYIIAALKFISGISLICISFKFFHSGMSGVTTPAISLPLVTTSIPGS